LSTAQAGIKEVSFQFREFTDDELEDEAAHFLENSLGPDVPIPVDVDLLIENVEGLDLDDWPGLKANYGVEGGVWRDPQTGSLFVFIDDRLMNDDTPAGLGRYRMTVAEELAHVHLHRNVIVEIDHPRKFIQLHNEIVSTKVERNAKRFAAALVMPSKNLREEVSKTYRQLIQRVGTDEQWVMPVKRWMCTLLAQRFQVTEMAMNIRLTERPMLIYDQVERAMDRGWSNLP
jgi:hypothetical protein